MARPRNDSTSDMVAAVLELGSAAAAARVLQIDPETVRRRLNQIGVRRIWAPADMVEAASDAVRDLATADDRAEMCRCFGVESVDRI